MFISPAYAQAAAAASPNLMDQLQNFAPIILIVAVFYLLLLRPQAKKAKQHKEMMSNLRRGDRVVTSGGLIGQISKVVNENEVQVELAEGIRVRVLRSAVSEILAKTEPVGGSKSKDSGSASDSSLPDAPTTTESSAAPATGGTMLGRLLGRK